MSRTPRTDAAKLRFTKRTYVGECSCVDAADMAQLETEADELAAALREGVEGFARIIVATQNQQAVSTWVKSGRALLAKRDAAREK